MSRRPRRPSGPTVVIGPRIPRCGQCRRITNLDELFESSGQGRSLVRQRVCRLCLEKSAKALVRLQHEREKLDRDLARYGIDASVYEAMLVQQEGRCAICGRKPEKDRRLAVDHDHKTGRVRGLLCTRCNTALGLYGDDVARFARVIIYLTDYQPNIRSRLRPAKWIDPDKVIHSVSTPEDFRRAEQRKRQARLAKNLTKPPAE